MGPNEIHRRQHELFNSRNFDGFDEFMRADLTYEIVPQGRSVKGLGAVKDWLNTEWVSVFPNVRLHAETGTYLEGPGFSIAMLRLTGRNDGALGSMPATGREVDIPAWELLRLDDEGRTASLSAHFDQLTFLTQLGQIPSPS